VTEAARVGLCWHCRWQRATTNRRGSTFYRCLRADSDSRFTRYPPLPVVACPGYEEATPADGPGSGSDYFPYTPTP
jgi:hypothetical protein